MNLIQFSELAEIANNNFQNVSAFSWYEIRETLQSIESYFELPVDLVLIERGVFDDNLIPVPFLVQDYFFIKVSPYKSVNTLFEPRDNFRYLISDKGVYLLRLVIENYVLAVN